MALIEWNDKYSVNHTKIDRQHKTLILIINQLDDALNNNNEDNLKEFFEELIGYTIIHFDTEDKLMDKYDYENTDLHKEEHNALKNQVLELQEKVNNGEQKIDDTVLKFLNEWLIKHIMGTDKKLGTFLSGRV